MQSRIAHETYLIMEEAAAYVTCPRLKSKGYKSTEICFRVCESYNRCYVVQNIYFEHGYKITLPKKRKRK